MWLYARPFPQRRLLLLILLWWVARIQIPAQSHELRIAAAADLQPVFPALAAEYERAAGVKLIASFGSSATLTQQLLNGAPQEVFLSADFAHPEQLAAAGLADSSPTPYARGVLVLWARRDSPAQPLALLTSAPISHQHSLDALLRPSVSRIAMANPDHAPFGAAAAAALKQLGLYSTLSPKLVFGENVSQTAQFALSGNAQAAFISLTLATSPLFAAAGSYVRVPAVYPEIRQSGIVLKHAAYLQEARAFLRWLTSPETQRQLASLGLEPVRSKASSSAECGSPLH